MKSPSLTKKEPSWHGLPRNVWVVTLTSFFTDLANEMLIQLIPLYLTGVLGVKTNVVGLIDGIAETTASILKIFAGWLSDRLGQRKWLTVLGYTLSTISRPFLNFASGWGGVLAVRFADRVGKGIRTAPRDALVADTTTVEQRGRAFGINAAIGFAALPASVIAGVLWSGLGSWSGFGPSAPFFLGAALAPLAALLFAIWRPLRARPQ